MELVMKFILFILGVILVPVALSASMSASVEKHTTIVEPKLKKLTLETNTSTLNRGEKAKLTLIATYQDSSTKPITNNIEWVVNSPESIEINATTLTALKDEKITLQAKKENIVSNSLELDITWIVNGHTLPPEPDKALNDSTLLGIDTNHNSVRDDVERWIYETYNRPIERGIFMQNARAYNIVIKDPSKALDTMKYNREAFGCEAYWKYHSTDNNENFSLDRYRSLSKEINQVQFNTIKRHIAYARYNGKLSGGVYSLPAVGKDKCIFNENGNLK